MHPGVSEKPDLHWKSLADYFIDWEATAFGFGYGTGEQHTLGALKQFFSLLKDGRSYDYRELETAMSPATAWLMINALCRDGVVEYGTSPRFGWLDPRGERLKAYVDDKTLDELYEVLSIDQEHPVCYKDACNCGPNGYDPKAICQNPFWLREVSRASAKPAPPKDSV